MIFAMWKSTFYNSFTRQKSIISFSFFGFSELPSAILGKKNWKIALIKPPWVIKTRMETYHLPSLCFQHPKYPESKTKITFYPNSTFSDIPSHARHSSWWRNFSGNFKVNCLLPFINFPATRINHSLIVFTSHCCTAPPVSRAIHFKRLYANTAHWNNAALAKNSLVRKCPAFIWLLHSSIHVSQVALFPYERCASIGLNRSVVT